MTLDVAQAQYAGGGPGHALVRLLGRARAGAPATAPPTLLAADGGRWVRLAAVPGTPVVRGDGAAFGVDFEVPLHLAVGDGQWFLEPGATVGPDPRVASLAARIAALGDEIAALRARVDAGEAAASVPPLAPVPDPEGDAALAAEPDAPSARATPVPRAARLRALRPGLPAVLMAAGALAVGDAVATVVWQEPVSALWASHEQAALNGDLDKLDATYATPQAADAAGANAETVTSPAQRMRALAARLEGTTRAGKPLGKLTIKRIHATYVMVQGTRASSLAKGPGHYSGTALPGQPGTTGIAGHRTTYGAPFRHIDALRRGDAITVTMPYGRFVYRVEGLKIVKPSDAAVLQSATTTTPRLVLTACHPLYSAAQRIVAVARLVSATPRGAAAPGTTA
ncbi:sortase [Conexibacter woesei]|uniref:sortase n=1 Tax=Conexibacter woesei TaxID=191495 RepID=UPI0004163EBF|nr:sortase [Conexibacter woesei]